MRVVLGFAQKNVETKIIMHVLAYHGRHMPNLSTQKLAGATGFEPASIGGGNFQGITHSCCLINSEVVSTILTHAEWLGLK